MRNNLANSWKVYAGFAIAAIVLFAIAPALLSDFRLNQLGKYLCFGIVAVGIGLAWGAVECSPSVRACSSVSAPT